MKPILLTDNHETMSVTFSDAPENPILSLIHTIRQQFLDHQAYRKPFLNCLCTLYHAGGGTHERYIRRVRPIPPTDSDIRDFIWFHWPQVQLKTERGYMPELRQEAFELRPLDDAIHVSCGLATNLTAKVTSKNVPNFEFVY